MMSFIDSLDDYAAQPLVVVEGSQPFFYADLLRVAADLASVIHKKSLVLCLCSNDVESLFGYLGLLRVRSVPALLNTALPPEQLQCLLDAYRPTYLWLPKDHALALKFGEAAYCFHDYVLIETGYGTDYAINKDLALLLTTSGSTGSPIFVRQSYRNLESNAEAIAAYLEITPTDRPITTLPMSYTYGLSIINSHVLKGCSIALTNRTFFDRAFWEFLRASDASTFGGVPYHYEMLKKLRFWKMELPSLRTLTQAGGKLDPSLSAEMASECRKRQIRFFTMYGQAEATARMSYLSPEKALEKAGSIGFAIPGGEFWIEDDAGSRCDTEEVCGELIYRGANVTLGYASGYADLAKGDENCGVLRTGDIARRDADGYYYIVGRKKRFLKLFGHRINLQEVEDELRRHGVEGACGGVDDHMKVFVVSAGAEICANVRSLVAQQLKAHPSAIEVVAVGALPRNEAGKILYAHLPSTEPQADPE